MSSTSGPVHGLPPAWRHFQAPFWPFAIVISLKDCKAATVVFPVDDPLALGVTRCCCSAGACAHKLMLSQAHSIAAPNSVLNLIVSLLRHVTDPGCSLRHL